MSTSDMSTSDSTLTSTRLFQAIVSHWSTDGAFHSHNFAM